MYPRRQEKRLLAYVFFGAAVLEQWLSWKRLAWLWHWRHGSPIDSP